jgi:hypothetical protein
MAWPAWIAASALAGPLLLVWQYRSTRRSLRPDWAALALAVSSVVIAASTACLITVIAWPAVARIPVVASIGQWSAGSVGAVVTFPPALSWLAAALGVLLLVKVGRCVAGEVSQIRRGRDTLDVLSATPEVVVVDDSLPFAYALFGWRRGSGKVVVSTGMLLALGAPELEAVLAHERAHLRHHHALYQLAGDLATAMNPLLGETRRNLDLVLERWADEEAAGQTDRAVVADALGKSALANLAVRSDHAGLRSSWCDNSVPARLESLLEPPDCSRWVVVGYVLLCAVAAGATLRALERTEHLVVALQKLH